MRAIRTENHPAKAMRLKSGFGSFQRQHLRMMAMVLLGLMLASSLSACGKRGEPYRPSEVPETSSTS